MSEEDDGELDDEDEFEPLCPELGDWFIHRADVVEAKARREIKAAIAAGKPMSERQIAALRLRARQQAELLRREGASLHRWRMPAVTDAELVERYAASIGADLAAPDALTALTALCAQLIRRHHRELTLAPPKPTPDHWPVERLVQLALDVDGVGDGPELERLERVRLNERNDSLAYPGEDVPSLQKRLQQARRLMGIAAPRGRPPRTG